MSKNATPKKFFNPKMIIFAVVVILVFILGLFAASIVERRSETITRLQKMKDIADWEPRNEVWGESFPKEYETYRQTLDTSFRSKYCGSAMIDQLETNPDMVILWAGYAFAKEYNQGRGHAYAITDIRNILRTGGENDSPQPATCWTCKSPDVPRMMAKMGTEQFYKEKWKEMGSEIVNPIGCQDCHDPKTMNLRITRPALVEALARRGKKMEDVTHQEMRSLVCAQCHVEYYFKGDGKYLTFPWDKGFSADSMESYYADEGFTDWTHKLSKTKMLKAQHPDYELYMTGVHAARNIACADCHMPYKVEGGIKFTDHHITSPLRHIDRSCQVCHRQSEEQLRADVYSRQDRVMEIRRLVERSLAKAHIEAQKAWESGASEQDMAPVLDLIRSAQWRWDWVGAANGVGFHSPVEALRVLGTSIERSEKARGMLAVILQRHSVILPVDIADIWTKTKAQEYIGLMMDDLRKDKEGLLKNVIPEWDRLAKERQGTLIKY